MATVAPTQALEKLGRGQKTTNHLETLIYYIISTREDINYEDTHDAAKNVSPKVGGMLMTIAEI